MSKPDLCHICHKNDAVWLVLDSKTHTYHQLYLDEELKTELAKRKQQDAYLACTSCRKQIERSNKQTKKSKPRQLQFLSWRN